MASNLIDLFPAAAFKCVLTLVPVVSVFWNVKLLVAFWFLEAVIVPANVVFPELSPVTKFVPLFWNLKPSPFLLFKIKVPDASVDNSQSIALFGLFKISLLPLWTVKAPPTVNDIPEAVDVAPVRTPPAKGKYAPTIVLWSTQVGEVLPFDFNNWPEVPDWSLNFI